MILEPVALNSVACCFEPDFTTPFTTLPMHFWCFEECLAYFDIVACFQAGADQAYVSIKFLRSSAFDYFEPKPEFSLLQFGPFY